MQVAELQAAMAEAAEQSKIRIQEVFCVCVNSYQIRLIHMTDWLMDTIVSEFSCV